MLKKILILIMMLGNFAFGKDSYNLVQEGSYRLKSSKHLVHEIGALNENNKVNILVEIPAGTNGKWEVNKETGDLEWEFKKGKPRVVQYLPYIGNYGMIPQTLSAKEEGGDGDPLDVILLGETVQRGSLVEGKIIGVMLMKDNGETDDKLIAVAKDSVFESINSIEDLNKEFPGVLTILQTWFTNYKGPNEDMRVIGFSGEKEANKILNSAMKEYKKYN